MENMCGRPKDCPATNHHQTIAMKLKTFVLPALACVAAFGMMLLTGCGETTTTTPQTMPSTNEIVMPPTNMPPANP